MCNHPERERENPMQAVRMAPWLLWLALGSSLVSATNYDVVVGGQTAEGFTFLPKSLTINVGDTVTWTWAGNPGHSHNVVAPQMFRCAQGCDGEGGNGSPSAAGWTFVRTFTAAGTVNYY